MPTAFAPTVEVRFAETTPTAKRIASAMLANRVPRGYCTFYTPNRGSPLARSSQSNLAAIPRVCRLAHRIILKPPSPEAVEPPLDTLDERVARNHPLQQELKQCDLPIHRHA